MTVEEKIKLIETICPTSIKYSKYTDKFYIGAECEIAYGRFLASCCHHDNTISGAIDGLFEKMITSKIVVGAYTPDRKEYMFNGKEFIELVDTKNV